jgi:shikimate dehydrogenase
MNPISRAAVLGKPIAHSRSPLIHGYWLKEQGLAGEYLRREVEAGTLAETLRTMRSEGFRGVNVTVPHKEEAFAACDRVSEAASIAGAVNTIWFEGDQIVGDNTDGLGFMAHLDQSHPGWDRDHPRILVIGAGGAARGLIVPLLNRLPKTLLISNRSGEKADQLVSAFAAGTGETALKALSWGDWASVLPDIDLVINTTSLGMKGQPTLDLDVDALPGSAIVADIVYVPLETPLLAAARARGLRSLDGLGMLLHQAVPGFATWFGVKPSVTEGLRAHLLADLKA